MSHDSNQLLLEALKAAQEELNGKEFFISAVLDRARAASNEHPHNQAIRTFQFVLEKRANREGNLATISQAEISELYKELGGLGNKEAFEDVLGDLLLTGQRQTVAHYNDNFTSGLRNGGDMLEVHDPNAAESLYGLFEEQSVKAAKGSFVDNGRKGVAIELASMGFRNPDVEVVARNQDFVIYAAAIDSNHGRISAYIPAEVKLGSVLMPSVFVSGREFRELTKENLNVHAYETISGKTSASPQSILETLNKLAGKQSQMLQVQASDEGAAISLAIPELYAEPVEEQAPFFEVPKVAMPKALEHLTEGQIRDALAEAGISFGQDIITAAKTTIATELRTAGVQATKITIASEFDGGLMVAANIVGKGGTKTIEVPVEVINGRIQSPSVFVSAGQVERFEGGSLRAFAADEGAGKFSAILSNKYGMSFKDLHTLMLRSAAFGNFVEVEETLAVIADQYGDDLHRVAHNDLIGLLNVGFGPEEKPLDAMDRYVKQAIDRSSAEEAKIRVDASVRLLYPEA